MFLSFSNSFFLYYSWLELKRYENIFNSRFKCFYLAPIRKNWFQKVSFLIRASKYKYSCLWKLRSSFISIKKDKILENSLFNIIYPFFENYYNLKIFSLNDSV